MRNNGYTLIQLLMVVALLAIIVVGIQFGWAIYQLIRSNTSNNIALSIPALEAPKEQAQLVDAKIPRVDVSYVNALRIDDQPVILKRHNMTQTLYACDKAMTRCRRVIE